MNDLKEQLKKIVGILIKLNGYKLVLIGDKFIDIETQDGVLITLEIDLANNDIYHIIPDQGLTELEIEKINKEIEQASIF